MTSGGVFVGGFLLFSLFLVQDLAMLDKPVEINCVAFDGLNEGLVEPARRLGGAQRGLCHL
ncbi:hypothetical protein IAD21_00731 [Abditibacteriota bacterium]|nr:hypothetical protein IAD21_00731 [Abditibacteriota bacterium]